jgi:hypothetical protein
VLVVLGVQVGVQDVQPQIYSLRCIHPGDFLLLVLVLSFPPPTGEGDIFI